MAMRFLSVWILTVLLIGLVGCDLLGQGNSPPVIESIELAAFQGGDDIDTASVGLGQEVLLTSNARDPDGDSLEYQWRSQDGTFLSGTRDTSEYDWRPGLKYGPSTNPTAWRAPEVVGEYRIVCTVSDGQASTKEETVIVMEPTPVRYEVEVSGELDRVLLEYVDGDGSASDTSFESTWEKEVLIPPGGGILLDAWAFGEEENPDAEDSPRKTVTVTARVYIDGELEATDSAEGDTPLAQITTEDVGDALP